MPAGSTGPPTREEKELFRPWLMKEIDLVRPHGLVTLGNVALQSFLRDTVGHLHGQWTRAVVSPPEKKRSRCRCFPCIIRLPLFTIPICRRITGATLRRFGNPCV